MSLFQAEKLIDLACSTTHEEEARTAALTACRMIRKFGMRLTAGAGGSAQRAGASRAAAAKAAPPREKPPNGGTFQRATRSGRCDNCGSRFAAGDTVYVVASTMWCERH